jgi:hypothetical protein
MVLNLEPALFCERLYPTVVANELAIEAEHLGSRHHSGYLLKGLLDRTVAWFAERVQFVYIKWDAFLLQRVLTGRTVGAV